MDDMIDRVITALDVCANGNLDNGRTCRVCPYLVYCITNPMKQIFRDALSVLREQKPRVMSVKELEETKEPVFIELRTKGDDEQRLTCFGLMESWDGSLFHFIIDQWLLDGEPFAKFYGCELKRKEYGIDWRPWNKRPKAEQMKEEAWNDKSDV